MNALSLSQLTSALLSADGLAGLIFLIMVAVMLLGGLMACLSERLVRSVAGLVVCFVGVAGIFYYLNSPFIAAMEMLIYVGAVSVTISFAIMLAAPEQSKKIGPGGALAGPLGFLTAGLAFGGLAVLGCRTLWPVRAKIGNGGMESIGVQLLQDYSMVFELVSLVLLIAILGALILARKGRNH
jgi:NADH:ubiquinone oxidoreductase subunit 6 (subunit J)